MEKTSRHKNRNIVLISFVANLVLLTICFSLFSPKAINNDDWIIHGITSGAYGEYSDITVHTNVVFTKLLVLLQESFTRTNWFALVEVLLCYISFSLVSSIVLLTNRNIFGIITSFILCCCIAFDLYLLLHNTKLTTVVSTGGLIALIYGKRNRLMFFTVTGWIIALISSLIRLNAFLMGAVFAIVLVLVWMKEDTDAKKDESKPFIKRLVYDNRNTIVTLLVFFISVAAFTITDIAIIDQNEEAKHYREYNKARGEVSDFVLPNYSMYTDEYKALGIGQNDYQILNSWNFADEEKFDIATLESIAKIAKKDRKDVFSTLFRELKKVSSSVYLWLFVTFIPITLVFAKKKSRVTMLLILFVFLLCMSYMYIIGRFTHWVISGILLSSLITLLLSFEVKEKNEKSIKPTIYTGLLVLSLFVSIFNYANSYGSYSSSYHLSVLDIFHNLSQNPNSLYLFDHATDPSVEIHHIVPAFSSLEKNLYNNCYSLGGWDTNSVAKNSILKRYGVEGSPYKALIERDNIYLVDTRAYEQKLIFIRENYDSGANISLVDVVDGYYVFAFTKGSVFFTDITEDSDISIIDKAVSTDENNSNFIYCGVKIDRIFEDTTDVYLILTNSINGDSSIFRAKIVEGNSQYAVVTSVRMSDLLIPQEYSIAVLQKTGRGYIASPKIAILE